MDQKRLKVDIEIHSVGNGRTFLNFWNYMNGDDVIAELKNGKLYTKDKNDYENEISLQDFVDRVINKF
jgi:hypothetical protein